MEWGNFIEKYVQAEKSHLVEAQIRRIAIYWDISCNFLGGSGQKLRCLDAKPPQS